MKDFLKGIFLICVIIVCACIIIWEGFAKPTFLSANYSCKNGTANVPDKAYIGKFQVFNYYKIHAKYLGYSCDKT